MGLRYERDSRRATNGPMIFFSILHDETFEEEIRSAFISGLSFYAYRFPHDQMLSFGSSEELVEGIGTPGFVIGMFEPSLPILTIPYYPFHSSSHISGLYTMPFSSTTREEYSEEVENIIASLQDKKDVKVVAARVILKEDRIDIAEKFYELCELYPEAFVFCFGTPATGCWIGASPELLLSGQNGELHTMALAGTRKSGQSGKWDEKNRIEQEIVTRYILDVFRERELRAIPQETFTKQVGQIEHICTPIIVESGELSSEKLEGILKNLAPTPALCGNPKDFALEAIKKYEHFERGCYGGFCGPFHSVDDFTLQVVLRCASVAENRYCIYVGGGITSASNIEEEWEETQLKVSPVYF